jgi:hypothetical protein
MSNNDRLRWFLFLVVAGLLGCFFLKSEQQNNQIVPPIPDAPPAPVVSDLPDMIAVLRSAKSRCEGRARAVIELVGDRRISGADMIVGRNLYVDTASEFDGCIDYLRAGLVRRFNEKDPEEIVAWLKSAKGKMGRFINWSENLERHVTGDFDPWAKLFDGFQDWLKEIRSRNEAAIEQLRNDLAACRFRQWHELALPPSDATPPTGALPPSS